MAICAGASLVTAGCGEHTHRAVAKSVPSIVGLKLKVAEEHLFRVHLRWRVAPDTHVISHLPPAGVGSSMDDIPVVGQRPAAGTPTTGNAVITIITPCTRRHPCA